MATILFYSMLFHPTSSIHTATPLKATVIWIIVLPAIKVFKDYAVSHFPASIGADFF